MTDSTKTAELYYVSEALRKFNTLAFRSDLWREEKANFLLETILGKKCYCHILLLELCESLKADMYMYKWVTQVQKNVL